MVKLLLGLGADPTLKAKNGQTSLDIAKSRNNTAITKLLEKHGGGTSPGGGGEDEGNGVEKKTTDVPEQATVGGKYSGLLRKIEVADDEKTYGKFKDYGRYTGTSWKGHKDLPAGYWVYVAPNWYIWKNRTDGASGTARIKTKRNWGPEQATGEPDTPKAGDKTTAWASLTPDGQDEWLVLEYEKAVKPIVVNVYETFNPGALYKVTLFDADGKEVVAWEGDDPTPVGSGKGVSGVKVGVEVETKKVKLYLKSKEVKGWNEIDAVGLVDKDGNVHWAKSAEASSTYAVKAGPAVAQGTGEGSDVVDEGEDYVPRGTTAEGLYREGSALRGQGKWKSAVKTWQTLIDKFPDHGRAGCSAVYMGQLQLNKKDYEGAEKSLRLAAEKLGHHKYGNGVEVGGYGYFYLVHLYCETEEYEKAGKTLKALVEKYPYGTGHRTGDALISIRAKRWFYEKLKEQGVDMKFLDDLIAEQKDPKNFDKLNSRQLYLIGHILKDEGATKKAIEAFKKTMWKFPKDSFTPYAAVFALELQLGEKDYEGATKTAEAMIKSFPDAKLDKGGPLEAIGYYGLGMVHFEKEEYKEAAEMFQKIAGDFPAAADMKGVSLRSQVAERYLEALKEKGFELEGIKD